MPRVHVELYCNAYGKAICEKGHFNWGTGEQIKDKLSLVREERKKKSFKEHGRLQNGGQKIGKKKKDAKALILQHFLCSHIIIIF